MPLGDWTLLLPETGAERRRGLLGLSDLLQRHALVLHDCSAIHTVGMRFAIDVVMLDRRWRTIRVIRVAPGRVLLPRPRVHHVLETTAGYGEALSRALG